VVAPLDDLSALIGDADVVVTSTGASDFVLSADVVQRSMSGRAGRPLVVMDLAMPRDVEPAAADIPGVHLYSMYDLELIAEANHKEREVEAVKAETIVADEVAKFRTWWKAQEVTPTIAGIRDHAESIRLAEVARTLKRLNGAGPEAADAVDALSKALVKKLLHGPTRTLHDRNDQALTEAARALFGLAEE
jgi:glutamyl-tRNA reductase